MSKKNKNETIAENAVREDEKHKDEKKVKKPEKERKKKEKKPLPKSFKYGVFSSSILVVVIVLTLVLNRLIEIPNIMWDLTAEQIYTVSDQTINIVKELEKEVHIYIMSAEDDYDLGLKTILSQYTENSSKIIIEYKDPELYPSFAVTMMGSSANVPDGSMIVTREGETIEKVRLVSSDDFYGDDQYTGTTTIEVEALLTEAINYVNDENTPVVYYLYGDGEPSISNFSNLQNGIERDNYEIRELNLLLEETIPEDGEFVFLNAPQQDFSEENCQKLRDYLDNGGKLYMVLSSEVDYLDNLYNMLQDYGIQVEPGIVIEQRTGMYYNVPYGLLPEVQSHTITDPIIADNYSILTLTAKGMTVVESDTYEVTELLTTSEYSYSKVDLTADYTQQSEEDIVGPLAVSVISESDEGGKLIVLGSSYALEDDIDDLMYGISVDFVINGIDYLNEQESKISVRAKTIEYDYTVYSQAQVYILCGVALLVIPAIIIIVGICISVSRSLRYKKKRVVKK